MVMDLGKLHKYSYFLDVGENNVFKNKPQIMDNFSIYKQTII